MTNGGSLKQPYDAMEVVAEEDLRPVRDLLVGSLEQFNVQLQIHCVNKFIRSNIGVDVDLDYGEMVAEKRLVVALGAFAIKRKWEL